MSKTLGPIHYKLEVSSYLHGNSRTLARKQGFKWYIYDSREILNHPRS